MTPRQILKAQLGFLRSLKNMPNNETDISLMRYKRCKWYSFLSLAAIIVTSANVACDANGYNEHLSFGQNYYLFLNRIKLPTYNSKTIRLSSVASSYWFATNFYAPRHQFVKRYSLPWLPLRHGAPSPSNPPNQVETHLAPKHPEIRDPSDQIENHLGLPKHLPTIQIGHGVEKCLLSYPFLFKPDYQREAKLHSASSQPHLDNGLISNIRKVQPDLHNNFGEVLSHPMPAVDAFGGMHSFHHPEPDQSTFSWKTAIASQSFTPFMDNYYLPIVGDNDYDFSVAQLHQKSIEGSSFQI